MKIGSLFSGIGGFDLAAMWAGLYIAYQVELDSFCTQVLKKRFPNVPKYRDITTIPNGHLPRVDIITGGFPCQPYSVAGKRQGAKDDRALWREMCRIINDTKPTWVIGENVPGIITMELDNIINDLEGAGYEVQTLIIPACAVGAQHIRSRVWILAYSDQNRQSSSTKHDCEARIPAHTNSIRLPKQRAATPTGNSKETTEEKTYGTLDDIRWKRFIKAGVCRGTDGIPNGMDRLKSLGNAIVPQIAYTFFKHIRSINY